MEPARKVFVIDDDLSVRKALCRLIRSAGYEVEEFSSAESFLDQREHVDAACLVLDVRMPGLDGIELQDRLAATGLSIPVVFLTGHGDVPMSVKAMKRGAVDFLIKPVEEETLLEAISSAITRHRDETRIKSEFADIQRRVETLTAREREVMSLVVSGMLNKQIAYQLGISEKTIKVHRARVMEKMCAGSLAELVKLAERSSAAPGRARSASDGTKVQ